MVSFILLVNASSICFYSVVADQKANLPMLPIYRSGGFTKITRMTDDFLELDGLGGRQTLSLSNGSRVEGAIPDVLSMSMGENRMSKQIEGPVGYFSYARDERGNRYVPAIAKDSERCRVEEIYPDGFYIVKDSAEDPLEIYRIYRFGDEHELWSQRFYCNNISFQGRVSGFLLFESSGLLAIFEIETGRNVLITDYNFKDPKPKVLGNYMIFFDKTVYDTRNWNLVLNSNSQVKGARVRGDILSYLSEHQNIEIDDRPYFYYFERNLSSGEVLKQARTVIPLATPNGYSFTEVYGAFNNFAYYLNPVKGSLDIYDVKESKTVFSHPMLFYSGNVHDQMDNGNCIAYLGSADIYCFDTKTGKMWTAQNQVLLSDGGRDGKWIVDDGFVDGKYVATFTHREHSDWEVTIANPPRYILTEYSCVIEAQPDDGRTKLVVIRHEFDGTIGKFETPVDPDKLYGKFLINGNWHFASLVDGRMNLFTTDRNGFIKVFSCDNQNRSFNGASSGSEMLFYLSSTKIGILEVKSGKVDYFVLPEKTFSPVFSGSRYIVFNLPGGKNAILDRKSGEVTYTENLKYLGFEDSKLYFSSDHEFATFENGKLTIIKNHNNVDGSFMKNGFIAGNNLFDTNGNFIQRIFQPSNRNPARDFNVDLQSMSFDLGQDVTMFPNRLTWKRCPSFSLERIGSGLRMTNMSEEKIAGSLWTGNLSSGDAVVKLEEIPLEVEAKTTVEIGKDILGMKSLVLIESNALLSTNNSKLENLKPGYVAPMFDGTPDTRRLKLATVVTVWGEDSDQP